MENRLDVAARIDELKLLADGWLDGRGRAPGPGGLDWARERYQRRLAHSQLLRQKLLSLFPSPTTMQLVC